MSKDLEISCAKDNIQKIQQQISQLNNHGFLENITCHIFALKKLGMERIPTARCDTNEQGYSVPNLSSCLNFLAGIYYMIFVKDHFMVCRNTEDGKIEMYNSLSYSYKDQLQPEMKPIVTEHILNNQDINGCFLAAALLMKEKKIPKTEEVVAFRGKVKEALEGSLKEQKAKLSILEAEKLEKHPLEKHPTEKTPQPKPQVSRLSTSPVSKERSAVPSPRYTMEGGIPTLTTQGIRHSAEVTGDRTMSRLYKLTTDKNKVHVITTDDKGRKYEYYRDIKDLKTTKPDIAAAIVAKSSCKEMIRW